MAFVDSEVIFADPILVSPNCPAMSELGEKRRFCSRPATSGL